MKLWLDDVRKPPWGYDLWAKTYEECVAMLESHPVAHVSLDHDLALEHYTAAASTGYMGTDIPRASFTKKTGYDVLIWMKDSGRWPAEVLVHTLNETGRRDMLALLQRHAPKRVRWKAEPYAPHVPGRGR